MWTRSRHGQYIECTCKLTANRTIMTNNTMTFNQVKCKQQHATHAVKPNLCIESLRLSYQQVASQPNSDHDGPRTEPHLVQHSPRPHLVIISTHHDDFSRLSHSPSHHISCYTLFINLVISGLSSISTETR